MIATKKRARLIAFYLPQFHPIPENDEWWGKGFTEWTNVGKAKPLFKGHYQPRVPADLGYYDLRIPEVREAQAEMAREAGVEGFCYWHYWFGDGQRLLERPFNEVLTSGKPDFPFCLGWANESWSGIWHGDANRILIEQRYPGKNDYMQHFYEILPAFLDHRYIRVVEKPLFYIYQPLKIPDLKVFFDCWNDLALKNGLKGIHYVAQSADESQAKRLIDIGFDAVQTNWQKQIMLELHKKKLYWNKLMELFFKGKAKAYIWNYSEFADKLANDLDKNLNYYPTILSGWDNSPRSGKKGRVFINYNPTTFNTHVKSIIEKTNFKEMEKNIIFLKSWNEWAEGNYMEPDLKFGTDFIDVLKKNIYL